eukprot:9011806-Pyramimonas_sp.AAC.1
MPNGEKNELDAAIKSPDDHWKRLGRSGSPRAPPKGRRGSSAGKSPSRTPPRSDRRPPRERDDGQGLESEMGDLDQGEAMPSVYLEARGSGSDEADALQCVASGFDEEISAVVGRLAHC